MTDRAIDTAGLAKVLRENEGSGNNFDVRTPHLKVTFDKDGQAKKFFAYASGTSIGGPRGGISGRAETGERASRRVRRRSLSEGKNNFKIAFDVSFNVPFCWGLRRCCNSTRRGTGAGEFLGNGKEGKLNFISAVREKLNRTNPRYRVVLTKHNHSARPTCRDEGRLRRLRQCPDHLLP